MRAVSRQHGQSVFLPGVGIVSLTTDKWENLQSWRHAAEDLHGGELPPFLVFSLFNEARWRVVLSPEVEAWKKQVLGQPAAGDLAVLLGNPRAHARAAAGCRHGGPDRSLPGCDAHSAARSAQGFTSR